MKHNFYLAMLLSLFLSACAATGGSSDQKKRFSSIGNKYPNAAIVVVESAGNFLSNKILLASIKAGTSTTTSDAILKLLLNENSKFIVAIMGDDESLSAATLERAMLDGKGKVSGSKAVFVGGSEYKEQLSKAAAESGVDLDFINTP